MLSGEIKSLLSLVQRLLQEAGVSLSSEVERHQKESGQAEKNKMK